MEYIKKLAGMGLAAVFAITLTIPVFAQDIKYEQLSSDQIVGDFLVGPGKVELELNPGESETVNVTLSNRMGSEKTFTVVVEDFVGSESTEQPVVLLGDQRGPYSLQDYLVVPSQEMTVGHAERIVIPITVSVPTDAEPGGRYGSVLFQTKSESIENGAKPSASIIVSPVGKGRAILFADNPNFRGAWYGTNKLFLNALFHGNNISVPTERN